MENNLELTLRDDNHTRVAHERWYSKQPSTLCRRCDRPFPNVDSGKTEYCSYECELGWFPNGQTITVTHKRPKFYRQKRHLAIGSFRSNWS